MKTIVTNPVGKAFVVSTISCGGSEMKRTGKNGERRFTPVYWETAVYPDSELGNYGDCPNCRSTHASSTQAKAGHADLVERILAGEVLPIFVLSDEWKRKTRKRV